MQMLSKQGFDLMPRKMHTSRYITMNHDTHTLRFSVSRRLCLGNPLPIIVRPMEVKSFRHIPLVEILQEPTTQVEKGVTRGQHKRRAQFYLLGGHY